MVLWVMELLSTTRSLGIVYCICLEHVFLMPSEVVMPLAGCLGACSRGLGAVLGALPLSYRGWASGAARLKRWADTYRRWRTVSCLELDNAPEGFEWHGGRAGLRCLPRNPREWDPVFADASRQTEDTLSH